MVMNVRGLGVDGAGYDEISPQASRSPGPGPESLPRPNMRAHAEATAGPERPAAAAGGPLCRSRTSPQRPEA